MDGVAEHVGPPGGGVEDHAGVVVVDLPPTVDAAVRVGEVYRQLDPVAVVVLAGDAAVGVELTRRLGAPRNPDRGDLGPLVHVTTRPRGPARTEDLHHPARAGGPRGV